MMPSQTPQSPSATPIPKRIIQTARYRDLTLKQRAFVANVRLLNPDFEWRFFDDGDVEQFIDSEFPEHRRTFDAFAFPIQRYDFFRYLAVYRLGGFYLDLDILLATGLASLRPLGCVFPFEGLTFSELLRSRGMDWEIGNYAFGAAAGHPFLEAVINNCVRGQRDQAWVRPMFIGVPLLSRAQHTVLYTTGPGLLSRTLADNPALGSQVTVLFPDDVCDAAGWNRFGDFGVHLMEGTWRQAGFLRRRLTQRIEAATLAKIVRRARRFGPTRTVPGHTGVGSSPRAAEVQGTSRHYQGRERHAEIQ
jgi:inositol phosphorylceramide mannosyltransferase catalytic subunit